MLYLLLIFVVIPIAFGNIRRDYIDGGCTAEFPVYGSPVFEAGEVRCRHRFDFIKIRYPDFESYIFDDVKESFWILVCGITDVRRWIWNRGLLRCMESLGGQR